MAKHAVKYEKLIEQLNEKKLHERIEQLARFGALPDGGVNRQAFSLQERQARAYLTEFAHQHGLYVYIDDCANLFFSDQPNVAIESAILAGSHLDSQPAGGKLDGAYGVLAALESLIILKELKVRTNFPIVAVAWSNEEGCRFSPGAMGSSAYVQPELMQEYSKIVDGDGISVAVELENTRKEAIQAGVQPIDMAIAPKAYIELHIEQGPKLEQMKQPLGVVTGIQGVHWYEVHCFGQAAHAGTTPMSLRSDAFITALNLINQLNQWVQIKNKKDNLVCTFGKMQLNPNAINTIAQHALFTIDIRTGEDALLKEFESLLYKLQEQQPEQVQIKKLQNEKTIYFDEKVIESVQNACDFVNKQLGLDRAPKLISGAFHDAMHLARICPTGMIFVPSKDGISHNPKEYTPITDLLAGAHALIYVLLDLAGVNSD